MKKIILLIFFFGGIVVFGKGNDTVFIISPAASDYHYSPTNIPLQMLWINKQNMPIKLSRPILHKNIQIVVYNEKKEIISTSPETVAFVETKTQADNIILNPNEMWGIYTINISMVISPRIAPDQTVNIVVKYVNGDGVHALKSSLKMRISAPDSKARKKFISEEKAFFIANKKIKDSLNNVDFLDKIIPTISLQEGIYTIKYPKKDKSSTRGDDYIFMIDVNATSGEVISFLGGR